jgi:hypothetical protein
MGAASDYLRNRCSPGSKPRGSIRGWINARYVKHLLGRPKADKQVFSSHPGAIGRPRRRKLCSR